MQEVARDVFSPDRLWTSVAAAPGVGKSWLASRLAIAWHQTRTDSLVVTTAPGWFQVENVIWREIDDAWHDAKLPLRGDVLKTRVNVEGRPKWYATGLSVREPSRFQGLHAPGGVLVLIDEANAVRPEIYERLRTFGTEGRSAILEIGNTYLRSGTFYEHLTSEKFESRVSRHTISAFDAPERIISRRHYLDPLIEELGEGSAMYQIQVLGQFPDEDEYGLFPAWLLERSRTAEPTALPGRHMGLDVARYGGDSCVALLVVDGVVSAVHTWAKADLMRTAGIAKSLAISWKVPPECVHVDVTGLGAGAVDKLAEIGFVVDDVDFGSGTVGEWDHLAGSRHKAKNRRTELYWSARRLLEEGQLSIPETYREVWTDLVAIPYRYDAKGVLEIIPKEKIKAKLGRSPDYADALVMALSRPSSVLDRVSFVRGRMPR